ncbi:unnamed protein product, partial [marine sediment metagenome]
LAIQLEVLMWGFPTVNVHSFPIDSELLKEALVMALHLVVVTSLNL